MVERFGLTALGRHGKYNATSHRTGGPDGQGWLSLRSNGRPILDRFAHGLTRILTKDGMALHLNPEALDLTGAVAMGGSLYSSGAYPARAFSGRKIDALMRKLYAKAVKFGASAGLAEVLNYLKAFEDLINFIETTDPHGFRLEVCYRSRRPEGQPIEPEWVDLLAEHQASGVKFLVETGRVSCHVERVDTWVARLRGFLRESMYEAAVLRPRGKVRGERVFKQVRMMNYYYDYIIDNGSYVVYHVYVKYIRQ